MKINLIKKIQDDYLDVMGVLSGKYAFKGPDTIQIDLTDHCNNNCIACWCNSPLLSKERLNRRKDALPAQLVKKLINDASEMGLREIYFSGGGEPFMHPDILEIMDYAKKAGIICSINTNFTLVDREIVLRLISLKVDYLTVSVWAATADIYKDLHPGKREKDFYDIKNTLSMLNSIKNSRPYVKVYNVICNVNYRQINQMLRFASETGSDAVEFTLVDTIPGATDRIILSQEQRSFVLRQFDEIRNMKRSHGISSPQVLNEEHFLRRVSNPDAQYAEYDSRFIDNMPCYIGWIFARVMPNGDVNSCLKSHRFPIGNIYKQSFRKIWNSNEQVYFRKKTLAMNMEDQFFSLIGNDPNCKKGCYKSCDDMGRNIYMHSKIKALRAYEKGILSLMAKSGFGGLLSLNIKKVWNRRFNDAKRHF